MLFILGHGHAIEVNGGLGPIDEVGEVALAQRNAMQLDDMQCADVKKSWSMSH